MEMTEFPEWDIFDTVFVVAAFGPWLVLGVLVILGVVFG